ncbi:MAG TPA: 4Fe-4S binding protein [Spirochaetota bacterium]|nr:4Fe-4S binding protein [Spirochaetota bacterium]
MITKKETAYKKVIINEELCKGCELCVEACPRQVLSLADDTFNAKGNRVVKLTDNERCTSCRACYIVCPDLAVEVYK